MQRLKGDIRLVCGGCGREMDYPRSCDPDLPNVVKTIKTTECDKCSKGDFGHETYFDVAGRQLDFETWKPFAKG